MGLKDKVSVSGAIFMRDPPSAPTAHTVSFKGSNAYLIFVPILLMFFPW